MWIHAQLFAVLIIQCTVSSFTVSTFATYNVCKWTMCFCVNFYRSPRHTDKYQIKRIVDQEGDIVQ